MQTDFITSNKRVNTDISTTRLKINVLVPNCYITDEKIDGTTGNCVAIILVAVDADRITAFTDRTDSKRISVERD